MECSRIVLLVLAASLVPVSHQFQLQSAHVLMQAPRLAPYTEPSPTEPAQSGLLTRRLASTLDEPSVDRKESLDSIESNFLASLATPKSKPKIILDDFEHIMESLAIFKQVYGDLEVGIKFEVPAQKEWPAHLQGLKLGKRLAKILSNKMFHKGHQDKVMRLKDIGFEPTPSTIVDDYKQIVIALKCYKNVHGDLRVPTTFTIPADESDHAWSRHCRGLKLGTKVANIRSTGRFVKDMPERKAELDELGFEWRVRDAAPKQQAVEAHFEDVLDALKIYHELRGSVDVPRTFVVPAGDEWKKGSTGMMLGEEMRAITKEQKFVFGRPSRIKVLTDMGVKINPNPDKPSHSSEKNEERFRYFYRALLNYNDIYGNVSVPQSFAVPEGDAGWKEEFWGLKLGVRVNSVRSQGVLVGSSVERREVLNEIGFVWSEPQKRTINRKNRIEMEKEDSAQLREKMDSLLASLGKGADDTEPVADQDVDGREGEDFDPFREGEDAPQTFEIGRGAGIHAEVEGAAGAFGVGGGSQQKALPNMGIDTFDAAQFQETNPNREFSAAVMREYLNNRDYSDDPDIRQFGHFEGYSTVDDFNKAMAESLIPKEGYEDMMRMGYRMIEFDQFDWEDVRDALITYRFHYGHVSVPRTYVITWDELDTDAGFDMRHKGMRLGEYVHQLRIGDVDGYEDAERRDLLDNLGFEWGDLSKYLRFRFYPTYLGLRTFFHLWGTSLPAHDFVVPTEEAESANVYPAWMRGMPLGLWTNILRIQQRLLKEEYPERYECFNDLEMAWWMPPALVPEKYYQPLGRA